MTFSTRKPKKIRFFARRRPTDRIFKLIKLVLAFFLLLPYYHLMQNDDFRDMMPTSEEFYAEWGQMEEMLTRRPTEPTEYTGAPHHKFLSDKKGQEIDNVPF